jgi:hypothetical protein
MGEKPFVCSSDISASVLHLSSLLLFISLTSKIRYTESKYLRNERGGGNEASVVKK